MTGRIRNLRASLTVSLFLLLPAGAGAAAPLRAGAAKVDVTGTPTASASDRLYVKALVIASDTTTVAVVTVDAVAIGELGRIGNDFLPNLRARVEKELHILPDHVVASASHCHGVVCDDLGARAFQAVKAATQSLVPVTVGAGVGHEARISENRRLRLEDGREADVRHAYALPPDAEVVGVGPIDPQIGILRLDRGDGRTLAVVYNFACHPIQGVPAGGNTADITGFASRVIEDNLSEGTVALFLQGCAGDINPVYYKAVDLPRNAEPLGNMLGLSTLKALRSVKCQDDSRLVLAHRVLKLPRADTVRRIAALEAEQTRLVQSLKGTSLNFERFLPLAVKYGLSRDFPSYYSHRYLHERAAGVTDLDRLDAENRKNMQEYLDNIHTMERLTRLQTNLALLRMHQAANVAAAARTLDVELSALRVGDFVLTTFPGELTVQTGLDIKKASPHPLTFVAGYTNGYIYYAPTAAQLANVGGAQEDSDCLVAPEWHAIYEKTVVEMLKGL